MNRRDFLWRTTAAASWPLLVPSGVLARPGRVGPNDRIQVGFIGCGGRARWLMGYEVPGTEIVAVADCFLPRCFQAGRVRADGEKWSKYQDYRKMLEKEKLDAVFVETTTHARVLIAMHALQSGLDVYAEKPLTLYVEEGRVLVNAVRKHNRILQTGTQQRSMPINRYASKLVREGAIGKVHTVIACNFQPPENWTPRAAQEMPDGLDWEQWCNQTELRPYHEDLQFKWARWKDYDGGGQSWGVTGWGTHSLDQVQCALGTDDTGPVEIWPEESGPRAKVTMRYASGTLLKLEGPERDHADLGAIFVGDKGRIEIKRGTFTADPPELLKDAPDPTLEGRGEDLAHLVNFFVAMRSREMPYADVEIGHRATTLCHLVNICRDLGRRLRWDPKAEKFIDDDQANKLLSRPRRKGFELPKISA